MNKYIQGISQEPHFASPKNNSNQRIHKQQ